MNETVFPEYLLHLGLLVDGQWRQRYPLILFSIMDIRSVPPKNCYIYMAFQKLTQMKKASGWIPRRSINSFYALV